MTKNVSKNPFPDYRDNMDFVRSEGDRKNGLKDGVWIEWYECQSSDRNYLLYLYFKENKDETLSSEEMLYRDKVHIRQNKFKKSTKLVTNYINGIKEGKRIGYNHNNEVVFEYSFVDNKMDGVYTEWDANQKIYECVYSEGIKTSVLQMRHKDGYNIGD